MIRFCYVFNLNHLIFFNNKIKLFVFSKSLAKELFKVLIIRDDTNELVRLDPSAEYPLFTDSIEKSINEIVKHSSVTEHIRLLIKWRSYDEISNFIRETDPTLVDYIHKTAHRLFDLDESDSHQQNTESPKSYLNKLITLNDCFDMYTQPEELSDDNSWTCTKCKRQTNASKKLNISTLPPILIIHLKRFFYESKSSNFKLTTPVWFPVVNLDLSSYVRSDDDSNDNYLNDSYYSDKSSNSSVNSQYIYDLYAVCNHKGQNMANGHYTAFCKNPVDTKWYNFDDSNCIPMSDTNINFQNSIFNNGSSNIFSENAYILFYKKRNCMKNEKWWVNYIERSLKDYNEFDYFYHNYDVITEKQNEQQNREQKMFLKSQFQSKVTGHRKRQDTDEFIKPSVFNESYTYEINHYDEFNRPKRLPVKQNSSPNKYTNSNSPSLDSNTTTSSSNFLINFEESQLANKFNKNVNISNDILNYPNDNEYLYQSAYNKPSSSNVILNQVYYPQSNFMYSNGPNYTSVSPSAYNISSIQRPTNLNVNQTARRYVNPKSIETPI
ncbi:unnamed protein product [Brachionus calyciflorus]|uniref:ubiquitinyl hydrolase 1 n=1 Tax=Brachionus calyciflorus TaxID=104777 RepID=A0A813YL20_9BILA|nr:unnamed protein product [Brachionus calyciflorus]